MAPFGTLWPFLAPVFAGARRGHRRQSRNWESRNAEMKDARCSILDADARCVEIQRGSFPPGRMRRLHGRQDARRYKATPAIQIASKSKSKIKIKIRSHGEAGLGCSGKA